MKKFYKTHASGVDIACFSRDVSEGLLLFSFDPAGVTAHTHDIQLTDPVAVPVTSDYRIIGAAPLAVPPLRLICQVVIYFWLLHRFPL